MRRVTQIQLYRIYLLFDFKFLPLYRLFSTHLKICVLTKKTFSLKFYLIEIILLKILLQSVKSFEKVLKEQQLFI